MRTFRGARSGPAWLAIDVAKNQHEALLESGSGIRRRLTIANTRDGFDKLGNDVVDAGWLDVK